MKLSNTVLLYKMEREKAMYWLSTKKAKIIMLLPTLMIYAVFIIIPVFIAIYYSFTDYSGLGKASFVGIKKLYAMFMIAISDRIEKYIFGIVVQCDIPDHWIFYGSIIDEQEFSWKRIF